MAKGSPLSRANDGLMAIGEFSRRTRLPISTLRYYHEIGLLFPELVDQLSGYRYYAARQLAPAQLIADLRRAGVAPDAIAAMAGGETSIGELVAAERQRIGEEIVERSSALAILDNIGANSATCGPVQIIDCPERAVASHSGSIDAQQQTLGLQRLIVGLRRNLSDQEENARRFGAVFPLDLEQDPISVTVFADSSGDSPEMSRMTIEAGKYATVTHVGRSQFGLSYAALLDEVSRRGWSAVGPVIEDYRGTLASPETLIAVRFTPSQG